jgi:hypothetical protein
MVVGRQRSPWSKRAMSRSDGEYFSTQLEARIGGAAPFVLRVNVAPIELLPMLMGVR